ncbi:unnamed protein product [Diabrotica balteata]|uniref:Uncharacterized protein n=1 Tax=Diabrotica balteata TaxID=107213 RepID=A0A9N9T0P5_DIABA|nr:unnamed protein product [Diabrotica balteata]
MFPVFLFSVALIEQWNKVNLALTSKVLLFMYGLTFSELQIGEDDLIPSGILNDYIAQSWYRFLKNPVSLTKPKVISQTEKFLQFAISTDGVADSCQHSCLQSLPLIFLKAIKGIAGQVDAFLGIPKTSSTSSIFSLTSFSSEPKTPLAPGRAKCNTILHLFREWLFEAAFIGSELSQKNTGEPKRLNSFIMDVTKNSTSEIGIQPHKMSESAYGTTPNVLDSPTIVLKNSTTKENSYVNERDAIISEIPTSEPNCTRRI